VKAETKGHTGFDSELIRGDTPIPKESVYFFRASDLQGNPPPSSLRDSVIVVHEVRFKSFYLQDTTRTDILAQEMEADERHHILGHFQ
jgi:hypothetical protein